MQTSPVARIGTEARCGIDYLSWYAEGMKSEREKMQQETWDGEPHPQAQWWWSVEVTAAELAQEIDDLLEEIAKLKGSAK